MDILEIYIKMCDYSEIQNRWHPNIGDLTDCGIIINVDKMVGAPWNLNLIEENPKDCNCPSHSLSMKRNEVIWLPYQWQIQKLCLESIPYAEDIRDLLFGRNEDIWVSFDGFLDFARKDFILESMEQLWLAFYMKTKYNKIWENEKWMDS